jgi:hypothetical protein
MRVNRLDVAEKSASGHRGQPVRPLASGPEGLGRKSGRRCRQHALDGDIDHVVPLVHLETLERRLRHQPGVVESDGDTAVRFHGTVDRPLHLRASCRPAASPPAR